MEKKGERKVIKGGKVIKDERKLREDIIIEEEKIEEIGDRIEGDEVIEE